MLKTLPLVLGVALMGTTASAEIAQANLATLEGEAIGTVVLRETPRGLLLQVDLENLSEDGHGFHIHETGSCADGFAAAGGHYNPHDTGHGHDHGDGAHVGDLPNIFAAADGSVRVDMFVSDLTFAEGEARLFDEDGSAFIVHAQPDTYGAEAGAGARIACGVIEREASY